MMELEECPFCGKIPKIIEVYHDKEYGLFLYDIDHECQVKIICNFFQKTKEDVIRIWNHRTKIISIFEMEECK